MFDYTPINDSEPDALEASVEMSSWRSYNSGYMNRDSSSKEDKVQSKFNYWKVAGICMVAAASLYVINVGLNPQMTESLEKAAWSSTAEPFSTVHPKDLGFQKTNRPKESQPGKVFKDLIELKKPFPTNAWFQNLRKYILFRLLYNF